MQPKSGKYKGYNVGTFRISIITIIGIMLFVSASFTMESFAQTTKAGKSGLPLPRFASLKSGKVNVRVGPGTDFKIDWQYQKIGLPMEIIQEFDNWRKVRDPEGNEGWVLHSLLSGRRTAVIKPWEQDKQNGLADLKQNPEANAGITARLQPGVVAGVRSCTENWCQLSVMDNEKRTLQGYVEKAALWGVYPDEFIEE